MYYRIVLKSNAMSRFTTSDQTLRPAVWRKLNARFDDCGVTGTK